MFFRTPLEYFRLKKKASAVRLQLRNESFMSRSSPGLLIDTNLSEPTSEPPISLIEFYSDILTSGEVLSMTDSQIERHESAQIVIIKVSVVRCMDLYKYTCNHILMKLYQTTI